MTSKKKAAAKSKKSVKSAAKKAPKVEATTKRRIAVLIADDHSVVREGLASLIGRKADMTVIAEAVNGREAVELWKQHHPDVTLLDLRMPELDGVGAIKEIRASDENARIIVLTTFDGDEDIFRAIQAGAKGYLLKDVPREALMDCIRRVHAGETCVPVHLAAKLAERVSGETLSAREIDVLKLMAHVAVRRLRRGDRGIIAILSKFAGKDRRPVIAQLNRRPAIRLKKIVGPVRQQAHRAG